MSSHRSQVFLATRLPCVTSGRVDAAIDGFVEGLEESILQSEAMAEDLTARAEELLSQAAQHREQADRQRGVLADLSGGLGTLVRQRLHNRWELEARPEASADPGQGDEAKAATVSAPSPKTTTQPSHARSSRKDVKVPFFQRIQEAVEADPSRVWTSSALRELFPGKPTVTFNKALKRLCDRGVVVREEGIKGRYWVRGAEPESPPAIQRPKDPVVDASQVPMTSAPPPVPIPAPAAQAWNSPVDLVLLRQRLLSELRTPSGRHARPEDLAAALGAPVASVDALLHLLSDRGEVTAGVDGSYLVPVEAGTEEDLPLVS